MSLSRYLREYRIVAGGKVPRIDGVDPHPWSAYRHPSLQRYSPLGPSSCVVMSMMAQMISRWYKALIITCDGDIYCPPSTSPAVIADVGELIDTQNHTLSQFE